MSSVRATGRAVRSLLDVQPCTIRRPRQSAHTVPTASARALTRPTPRSNVDVSILSRGYATSRGLKLDVQRLRHDVDERARLGFYTLAKQQGALLMERDVANAIVKEFLAKQNTVDPASNIKQLASSVFHPM